MSLIDSRKGSVQDRQHHCEQNAGEGKIFEIYLAFSGEGFHGDGAEKMNEVSKGCLPTMYSTMRLPRHRCPVLGLANSAQERIPYQLLQL